MRELWPAQREALQACLRVLGRSPAYVQMPTGSGKSEIMRLLALQWLTNPRANCLIVVPNQTLAYQHKKGFVLYSKQIATLLLENFPVACASRLIISTYASLHQILTHPEVFGPRRTLLLLDECHHCNASAGHNTDIVVRYPNRIGFSATPWMDGTSSCFGERLAYALPLNRAQEQGILCEFEISIAPTASPSINDTHQLYFVKDSSRFDKSIVGRSVYYEDDQSIFRPFQNSRLVEMFRFGQVPCLYVNRMLLEGFDCPDVKTIFIEKESDSEILAMQMLGRGLRKLGNRKCNVFVTNARMYATMIRAIERANTPSEERRRWHESS